jgi:hypothetical protein
MSNHRNLTARGVKTILTRAGLDHSELSITDHGDSVEVAGTRAERREVSNVLYDRGLWCAPYPDRDCWSAR